MHFEVCYCPALQTHAVWFGFSGKGSKYVLQAQLKYFKKCNGRQCNFPAEIVEVIAQIDTVTHAGSRPHIDLRSITRKSKHTSWGFLHIIPIRAIELLFPQSVVQLCALLSSIAKWDWNVHDAARDVIKH